MKAVCIVEDDPEILSLLSSFFKEKDFEVYSFSNFFSFKDYAPKGFQGAYLIDWNLPDRPGTDLVQDIRQKDKVSPIFIVSGKHFDFQISEGLQSGADDYITKPLNLDHLLIKVNNAINKLNNISKDDQKGIQLIPSAYTFIKDGDPVRLTSKEYIIFDALYSKKDEEAVSREELLNVTSKENINSSRNIDVHIVSLRKKLERVNIRIKTIWKKGYRVFI
ncbi:MAG: response regulator transcription factor [Bacteriovoracaceae bacterium]|jgi:DNA-binding response OmpR family regulator|nr:response regulator transcription factor [Bacteriovoracaceae bacterium]